MYKYNCSFCASLFEASQSTSKAFCQACADRLKEDEAAAIQHRQRILSGHPTEIPDNDTEKREVHRAIRKRLTSAPDCKYSWIDGAGRRP